ncbi:MAG: PA2169 family four-helix-bundle protein [Acidimicrobiia bacterium]
MQRPINQAESFNENEVVSLVSDLVETLEDSRKGFLEAAEHLDRSGHHDLAERMKQFSDHRTRLSLELREVATELGEPIVESGSVGGAVHRGWMSIKDAVTDDDPHEVLAAAEKGEDHAVAEYERALEKIELPNDVRKVIHKQASEVRASHDEVKMLRERYS